MGFFSRLFAAPKSKTAKDHFLRAMSLLNSEDIDGALAAFDAALALEPRNVNALHWKGVTLHVLGKFDDALACFDAAIIVLPQQARFHFDRGKVLQDMRRNSEAVAALKQAQSLLTPDIPAGVRDEINARLRELGA